MIKTAEQLLVELLKSQLNLGDDNVWVRSQNRSIPPDNGLYIVVGMTDSKPLSSQSYIEETVIPGDPPTVNTVEIQRVQTVDNIQIDFFSRDPAALTRRWEIIAALSSIESKQLQEENFFKIPRLPNSFVNTSGAEGGSNINRYTTTFATFVWYRKERVLSATGDEYYDSFYTRVDDYKSITEDRGIIEFRIAGDGAYPRYLATHNNFSFKTHSGKFIAAREQPTELATGA